MNLDLEQVIHVVAFPSSGVPESGLCVPYILGENATTDDVALVRDAVLALWRTHAAIPDWNRRTDIIAGMKRGTCEIPGHYDWGWFSSVCCTPALADHVTGLGLNPVQPVRSHHDGTPMLKLNGAHVWKNGELISQAHIATVAFLESIGVTF